MNKPTKLLMIAGSTTAIVFFSIYAYKTYKKVKAEIDAEATEEELQEDLEIVAEVTELRKEREDTFVNYDRDAPVDLDPNEIDYTKFYEDEEEVVEEYEDEGEEKLMYPPNSPEALNQWRGMRLADIHQENTLRLLTKLFDFRFIPSCEEDDNVMRRIIDDKMQFFGASSLWIDEDQVSVADVILHYAGMLSFDLGNDINMNATVLINNFAAGLDMIGGDIEEAVHAFSMHTLMVNSSGEGIFAIYHGNDPTSFEKDYFKYIEAAV